MGKAVSNMPRVVAYLRFPVPRNGSEDPPLVNWNAEKENELWALLKSGSSEIDWSGLAKKFNVSTIYILQQAAWLYEKEMKLLRERMTQIHTQSGSSSLKQPSLPSPFAGSPQHSIGEDSLDNGKTSSSTSINGLPARRLMSVSRAYESEGSTTSLAGESMDGFVPEYWQRDTTALPELTSSSENSVTQSALEEALMNRSTSSR